MTENALAEQRVINEVQKALDEQQFLVYLQPKYDLKTERPYGAEALIRWLHPERGLIPPGQFIPVVERNGYIGRIDFYMWDKVCALLRKWLDEGQNPGPISVNVSRADLHNPNLTLLLSNLVNKYGVPPKLLNLELTESAYMEDPEAMEKTVRSLQKAGFRILMDDFGSGYSSLNTLKNIPVDVLKIDMKFLSGDAGEERGQCILSSVIRMAGWLHMPVIMEGVETKEQVEFLKSIGCGYVQGYYFARPMPVADYEDLIRGVRQMPTALRSENLSRIIQVLWEPGSTGEMIFESMDTAAAIFEYDSQGFRALRVNRSFSDLFGYGVGLDSHLGTLGMLSQGDSEYEAVSAAFSETAGTGKRTVCRFRLHREGMEDRAVDMTLRYWGINETARVLLAQFAIA